MFIYQNGGSYDEKCLVWVVGYAVSLFGFVRYATADALECRSAADKGCSARGWNLLLAAVLMVWGSAQTHWCGAPPIVAQAATLRASVDSNGNQGNDNSGTTSSVGDISNVSGVSLSADGSKVAFASNASNLVSGDTNGSTDVFVNNGVVFPNQPPSISDIANQTTPEDTPLTVNFSISDAETSPANLTVTATSDNQVLVNNANLTLGGSDANRS